MTSNHFWWFQIPKYSFCFAIFFCYASVLVFYVLGLDSCIVASELVFWITKSGFNLTVLKLDFFLFALGYVFFYVFCMGVWVSKKCCVVCFGFYITSWFLQEFCFGCKYCSVVNLSLLLELKKFTWQFWCFCICFPCTIPLGIEPKHGQILGVWKLHKMLKKKKQTHKWGPPTIVAKCPPLLFVSFLFFPFFLVPCKYSSNFRN